MHAARGKGPLIFSPQRVPKVLILVAVCCSVLQCVAVPWAPVAVCCTILSPQRVPKVLILLAVCCRVPQCVAVCCSAVSSCCSVAVCCSAVSSCCSVLYHIQCVVPHLRRSACARYPFSNRQLTLHIHLEFVTSSNITAAARAHGIDTFVRILKKSACPPHLPYKIPPQLTFENFCRIATRKPKLL